MYPKCKKRDTFAKPAGEILIEEMKASVMKRLASLPKQHALFFGNGANISTRFRMRCRTRPKNDDAAIRKIWFQPACEPVKLVLQATIYTEQF
jgi:hypothetical protein